MQSIHPGNADFNTFWLGQALSHIGAQITLLAVALIAGAMLGATAAQMGYLLAAESLPYLLFALPAGAWVDRLPRRQVLVVADLARTGLLLCIPLAAGMQMLSIPLLLGVGFLATTAAVFHDIAGQAMLTSLVAPSDTMRANAKLEFTRAGAAAIGPGLAGLVAQWLSPALCLLPTAISHGVSALNNLRLPLERPHRLTRSGSLAAEIREGLHFVLTHRVIRALAGCALIWNGAWYALNAVFVLFATRELGLSASALGVVLAAQGGGMLCGALAAAAIRAQLGLGRTLLVGPVISLLACLACSGVLPLGKPVIALLVGQFLFGFGPMVWTVSQLSTRQNLTPAALQGRVSASIRFVSYGMRPVGALAGGWAGSVWGLQPTILACVGLFGLALAFLLASPVPGLTEASLPRHAPEDA
jgi:predicted MFS family arabinose efflux permease